MFRSVLRAFVLLACAWSCGAGAPGVVAAELPPSGTVPITLDHNRMTVEVEFVRPDGSVRQARAWVDTGSPDLTLAEPLARDLGLDVSGLAAGARAVVAASPALAVRLGGLPLAVAGVRVCVVAGAVVLPGVVAEATLPASLFRNDHVVFDYPARRLTVARPGVLAPRGVGLACRVNAETGLFMIAATVEGDTVQFGVDTGSAGTWVSSLLTAKWQGRHPNWPQATGAAGSANFFGFPFETEGVLMRLPELEFGGLRVREVGLLGLDQSLFDWYSQKSAAPVVGFLGANVLWSFRLEIDFPSRMSYWEMSAPVDPRDFDIVGLTLRPEADGGFTVAGVVNVAGRPAVDGVAAGDRLIRVDELEVANAAMGDVVNALRGEPGSTRALVIERGGERLSVVAGILRLP
jgi:predicted aspartyl protease